MASFQNSLVHVYAHAKGVILAEVLGDLEEFGGDGQETPGRAGMQDPHCNIRRRPGGLRP